jgi:RNA polymerase sigma-70 factor, ECF subfamily
MNKADPEDIEDIIRRARLGDAEAFGVLYQHYFTPLYRYIYFRIAEKADTDDLTQEIFLKAYESFSRYTYSGASPLAYFYAIARNMIIDHHRKKKAVLLDDEVWDAVADDTQSIEAKAAEKEDGEELRKRLAVLPEGEREAVTLKFINGLSNKEISVILGKSEAAVRQLQSRGLRAIKTMS